MTATSLVELVPSAEPYEKHSVIMIWMVKFGGILSMIATTFTIRDILTRFLHGETIRLTSKLIFEWALAAFGASFWSAFLSSWMVPVESGIYMASGNTVTCTIQGFLDSFFYGITVLTYTVLAMTYCFLVKFKRKDELPMSRNLMMILGASPTVCFVLALAPLFDQAYNYTELHICGIAEYPMGCLSDLTPFDCERGENARQMWISRFFIVCWANLFIIISVVILIRAVLARENRMIQHEGYARRSSLANDSSRSRNVMWQGIWYILAFEISWGAWYAFQFIRISADKHMNTRQFYDVDVSAILYIGAVTHPTQGVWISMVYFRPKYLKFRQRDPHDFRLASVMRVLNLSVPRILTNDWWEARKRVLVNDEEEKDSRANDYGATTVTIENNNIEMTDSNNSNNIIQSKSIDDTQ